MGLDNLGIPVIIAISFWSTLYFIVRYCFLRHLPPEWSSRVVAGLHGAFVTVLSIWSMAILGPRAFTEPGSINTELEVFIMTTSVGYFIYDSFWCLCHHTEGIIIYFHHMSALLTIGLSLLWGNSGSEIVASIMCGEITNPLLQIRWFLREANHRESALFVVVDLTFVALFFVSRMIVGTMLLICTWRHPRSHIIMKLGGLSMWIISVVFMAMILNLFWKKYLKPSCRWALNTFMLTAGLPPMTHIKKTIGNECMKHAEYMKPCKVE